MNNTKNITSKISNLPPELLPELESFIDYLISKQNILQSKMLKQDWAGGLKSVKMSSLELQKKALEWR
jgi:hypothetical protein